MSGHDLSPINYPAGHDHSQDKVAIIVSKWNAEITEVLYEGAMAILLQAGIPETQIYRYDVPGSYELPAGARMVLSQKGDLHGVICIGCVIQGETRHFEFISQSVAMGIMQVGVSMNKPVIFGVLTPDTQEQAFDRAGGKYGNKGSEAAVALLEMLDLSAELKGGGSKIGY